MKIIIIGPFPPPIHGLSLANRMLVNGLRKSHIVCVINTQSKRARNIGNLSEQGKLSILKAFDSLFRLLVDFCKSLFISELDLVYMTPGSSVAGFIRYIPFMWLARIKKVPYFVHIHGSYFRVMYDSLSGWKKLISYRNLKGLSGAIVLGPSLKCIFEGLVPDEKIFVCENGVEDEVFATEEEIRQKIERYNTDDTIRIVYLSNLMESKGILDLFEAVKMLRNRGEKIHLDVAGAIEPVIEDRVETYLKELGDSVTYHGVVEGMKKKELLLSNYIFCLPSKHPYGEGQPISILEAMANGCAIVTTDHGGIKDVVSEDFGVFVEKQNPVSIANSFEELDCETRMINSWFEASQKYRQDQFVSRIERVLLERRNES